MGLFRPAVAIAPHTVEDGSLAAFYRRRRSLKDMIVHRLTVAKAGDVLTLDDEILLNLSIHRFGPQHRRLIANCGPLTIHGPVRDVDAYFVQGDAGHEIVKAGLATRTFKGAMLNRNGLRLRELLRTGG